jgi:hypothetical protein
MFRIFKVLKEISLYREYLKAIKKESFDSPEWSKLRLRKDWFGRIYTVFNLPPEVTKSPDFPKYARPAFVFDQIKPINEYLTKLSLQELIAPTHALFLDTVARARKLTPEQRTEIASASVYTSQRSLELGLIDAISSEADAINGLRARIEDDANKERSESVKKLVRSRV